MTFKPGDKVVIIKGEHDIEWILSGTEITLTRQNGPYYFLSNRCIIYSYFVERIEKR